ncbi:albusnodin/ikarugamycin family macrolactam cyclase [Streptomyces olivaceus]|uniref:albusnodin/ikarugamycin family macrolactam cyclase n=2 Tax=Streptomyces olivaceus TaxID=47716 RepID=UPI0027E1B7C6|nr:albusnodin/ikarugamycin family macrolactam cyclase [Streptomyces olivaceus]
MRTAAASAGATRQRPPRFLVAGGVTMKEYQARWYGGCAPGSGIATTPVGARLLWKDPALWVSGDWRTTHLRTLELGAARIAVLGPCAATEQELAFALSCPDLASAAGFWAGSHTVVRASGGGTVEVLADAAGSSPLYLVNTADGVVWGSSSFALSPLAGGNVDTEWIAAYVREKYAPATKRSAWSGVKPVPAGHMLTLGSPLGPTSSAWWARVRRTPGEASAALRRALGEGVRVRVEGVSATTDLAGMDSTTVALLAAQHGTITGVTLHPSGVANGGDMRYARALVTPGLDHRFFPLDARHLPFASTDLPLPATDEPAPSTPVWSMFSEQLGLTASAGMPCHLTGDGGDNLFLSAPTHLGSLARHGHWWRMFRDAMGWSLLRRLSPGPLIVAACRSGTAHVGRPARPCPAWLMAPVPDANTTVATDPDTAFVTSLRTVARSAYAEVQLADALGVALHNPYFDGTVLDAVVSAPIELRYSARRYKPMLVDTFSDLLPEAHRKRAAKGLFVGDFHQGLRVNLPRVLGLADKRLAALGIIAPVPLTKAMHAAALGARTVWPSLLSAVATEEWLEAVENTPKTTWTRTAVPPAGAQ